MGRIRPRIPTTIGQDLKQYFSDYPEHYVAGVMACIGITYWICETIYNRDKWNKWIVPYGNRYTVFRPDDPRAWRIRCSPDLPADDPRILKVPAPPNEIVDYANRTFHSWKFQNHYRRDRARALNDGQITMDEIKADELKSFKGAGYSGLPKDTVRPANAKFS